MLDVDFKIILMTRENELSQIVPKHDLVKVILVLITVKLSSNSKTHLSIYLKTKI